jgi:hypothetical protein
MSPFKKSKTVKKKNKYNKKNPISKTKRNINDKKQFRRTTKRSANEF